MSHGAARRPAGRVRVVVAGPRPPRPAAAPGVRRRRRRRAAAGGGGSRGAAGGQGRRVRPARSRGRRQPGRGDPAGDSGLGNPTRSLPSPAPARQPARPPSLMHTSSISASPHQAHATGNRARHTRTGLRLGPGSGTLGPGSGPRFLMLLRICNAVIHFCKLADFRNNMVPRL